ncbi:MAG: hypothetical protein LBR73_09810 [Oscillospiraceae bacterium]|jgi:hypothetical protein|nr:hypothetical protein [Oscillospiraceae bacterium]
MFAKIWAWIVAAFWAIVSFLGIAGWFGGLPGGAQLPNPIRTYTSTAELSAAVGYTVTPPGNIAVIQIYPDPVQYTSIGNMAQLTYPDGTVFRMKPGAAQDISGDYTEYPAEQTSNSVPPVTLKGDGTSVFLALWRVNSYNYSLYVPNGEAESFFITAAQTGILR